jgi:hypothetical protein
VGKVLVFVGAMAASIALVGTALATHAWGNYHWARTANPFTLKLGDNVNSTWDSYLGTTSFDWSQSAVLDTTIVAGKGRKNCRPTAGQIEVCNGTYGNNGWLGIAQIWASGDHITQATTKVNDTYFNTATYNSSAWRNLVMCQEVGHDFGLSHQDENFSNPNLGTCMDYTNNPSSNQHPNQHDYDQLALIYAHLDSSTTIASAPAALPGNAPPFSHASRANGDVYVDDLGNGTRRVTHVLWTPFGE